MIRQLAPHSRTVVLRIVAANSVDCRTLNNMMQCQHATTWGRRFGATLQTYSIQLTTVKRRRIYVADLKQRVEPCYELCQFNLIMMLLHEFDNCTHCLLLPFCNCIASSISSGNPSVLHIIEFYTNVAFRYISFSHNVCVCLLRYLSPALDADKEEGGNASGGGAWRDPGDTIHHLTSSHLLAC